MKYSTIRRCSIWGCDRVAQPGDIVCKACSEELAALERQKRGWWEKWGETVCAVFVVAMVLLVLWIAGSPFPENGSLVHAFASGNK